MQKYLLWGAMGLVSLVMVMGGVMKLTGQEMALASFSTLGLPVWFGMFIGVCELAGAAGLWVKRTSALAALGIALIMIGAIYYHVMHTPLSEGVPAIVVLVLCGFIILRRRAGA
ncbi:MAG: DoxX family protein [Pseudomonadota bacterium]